MAKIVQPAPQPVKPTDDDDDDDLMWLSEFGTLGKITKTSAGKVKSVAQLTESELIAAVREKAVQRINDRINFLMTGSPRTTTVNKRDGSVETKTFGENSRNNYYVQTANGIQILMKYGAKNLGVLIEKDTWGEALIVPKEKLQEPQAELKIWQRLLKQVQKGYYDEKLVKAAKEIAEGRVKNAAK